MGNSLFHLSCGEDNITDKVGRGRNTAEKTVYTIIPKNVIMQEKHGTSSEKVPANVGNRMGANFRTDDLLQLCQLRERFAFFNWPHKKKLNHVLRYRIVC
ncbi:hypothetical protein AVEN_97612-1 [Araneus ventricosus]|uniref:Uncharacterized protein n=1 Tax=Araneus ventricosus TaxID=182803 RepID=A0A4Y2GG78_ARAVE|nr:hypothetical protein AVEN_97612-1 [Araneus ventricosus]